jgi:hypothetical protein
MGGDFNLVADAIDRMPHRTDSEAVITAYLRFTRMLGLIDGWRQCNPNTKEYTHIGSRKSLSRIDKILVSPALMKNCRSWEITDVGSLADHKMVTVTASAPGAPYIGPGRWQMPHFLLHNSQFMEHASREVYKLEASMNEQRTELCNAQTKFKAFKDATMKTARVKAKVMIGASEAKKESLKKEMKVLLNDTPNVTPPSHTNTEGGNPATLCSADTPHSRTRNTTTRDTPREPEAHCHECDQKRRAEEAALIQKKIDEIIDRQCERKRLETRVRGTTELNHITKYAVNLSKEKKPRDTIEFLR